MGDVLKFLLTHGYLVLFGFVLAEQIGLPIPSSPLLLAAGALAGLGRMNLAAVLCLAVLASLISDSVWFALGKSRGGSVLDFVCKLSPDPESCVSKTRSVFTRFGPASLLIAKFLPEVGTLGPPVAGLAGLSPWKFVLFDFAGALAWSGTYTGLGWIFRDQLEAAAAAIAKLSGSVGLATAAAIAVLLALKFWRRRPAHLGRRILSAGESTELRAESPLGDDAGSHLE